MVTENSSFHVKPEMVNLFFNIVITVIDVSLAITCMRNALKILVFQNL